MLDFFAKKPIVADEHSTHPGDATTPPNSPAVAGTSNGADTGSIASAQGVAARAEAVAALQTSPRRRGRPPNSAATSGGNHRTASAPAQLSPEMRAELSKALEGVYSPEAWGALLGMPADGIAAITGRERWELSKEERKTLGVTGSAAARCLSISNPTGLAILMVASAITSAYVPRAAMELREFLDRKRKEKIANPRGANVAAT